MLYVFIHMYLYYILSKISYGMSWSILGKYCPSCSDADRHRVALEIHFDYVSTIFAAIFIQVIIIEGLIAYILYLRRVKPMKINRNEP